jgi:hypothetical protein
MKRNALATLLALVFALAGGAGLFACSQTPTSVPVRTFERAQRMDVVCLQVYDPTTGLPNIPEGRRQEECAPVPPSLNGGGLLNQLFALVTQSTRGELAVVNLSAGELIDQSRPTPGINFVPVGGLPTDVAVTPDGQMAFVGSAETNKAAIYGIPTRRILGDTVGTRPADPDGTPTLASWPVCALPQNPGALTVVPRARKADPFPDAGTDAGVDAGPDYELVVVLPGDHRSSAKIVTLDPRPFIRGARPKGTPVAEGEDVLAPGSLAPCKYTAAIELVGEDFVPSSFRKGAAWGDGIPAADGGVNLTCDRPAAGGCKLPSCCASATPVAADGGEAGAPAPSTDGGACTDTTDAGEVASEPGPLDGPRLVAAVRDDQLLYVADGNLPLVHVIDLSVPGAPQELAPLMATSLSNPSRPISIRDLSVSPTTRDYKRYLYAVDREEGSILVYDVTDPKTASREPLRRPHPELNPFQPEDRIAFGTPVVAVSFARHDWPLRLLNGVRIPDAKSGVLCNPNPNLTAANATSDYGFFFRANSTDPDVQLGPRRLRGIFGFATLANGSVVAIDVDDWDAPCRAPAEPIAATDPKFSPSSLFTRPAPAGPTDLDAYHGVVPEAVTGEVFFPVSAPHRMRSDTLLKSDATSTGKVPRLDGTPSISANGTPLAFAGPGSEKTPLILPTGIALPAQVSVGALGVRFATESADVHIDQDWTLTYEGIVPGFDGLSAFVKTEAELANAKPTAADYETLVLQQSEARFCARGVEDWTQGGERAGLVTAETRRLGGTPPNRLDRQMVDYVQLTEDLLSSTDPYWNNADDPGQCWGGIPAGRARYDACNSTYGAAADQRGERDFPILEAYDDHVVVGRFYTPADGGREAVSREPSNAPFMRLMRCCFHHQVRFRVRTGGEWSLVGRAPGGGAGVGFLSHMQVDANGRCVTSCEQREALLSSRAPAIPGGTGLSAPDRNSAVSLRNPMFSFWMVNGLASATTPVRDTVFTFRTRGQFTPLTVNVGGGTISVNPQSMRFIETLGQIAVVDAASQGLVLIDLGGVAVARAPYF